MGLAEFRRRDGLARWERASEQPMLVFSVLFAAVLILPYAYPLTPTWERVLGAANLVLWLVFLVDYLARVFLAMDRWHFIRTHVLALLVVAVPFLRPLRLLMLVAVVGQFIQRAKGGVRGRVLAFVLLATVVLMSTAAVLVYGFERTAEGSSIVTLGDAVWWAIATVTTVGYGDSIPVTPEGRTVAAGLMVVGIGLVGTLTAFVAAWFVQEQEEEDELAEQAEQAPMEATVRLLADRVAELQEEVARLRADLRREEG